MQVAELLLEHGADAGKVNAITGTSISAVAANEALRALLRKRVPLRQAVQPHANMPEEFISVRRSRFPPPNTAGGIVNVKAGRKRQTVRSMFLPVRRMKPWGGVMCAGSERLRE